MSISKEQLRFTERLPNPPALESWARILSMNVMAPVQIGTADDHAICHKVGQQAVEFHGRGMRLTACVISGSLIAGFIYSSLHWAVQVEID